MEKKGGRGNGRKNQQAMKVSNYFIVSHWFRIACDNYSLSGALERAVNLLGAEPGSMPIGIFEKTKEGRILCSGLALENGKKIVLKERPHPKEKISFFLNRMKVQYYHNRLSYRLLV